MAEETRQQKIERIERTLRRLNQEYGTTGERGKTLKPVYVPKKKPKTLREWIQEILGIKKKKPQITVPSGVRTPEQIKEFKEIMEATK